MTLERFDYVFLNTPNREPHTFRFILHFDSNQRKWTKEIEIESHLDKLENRNRGNIWYNIKSDTECNDTPNDTLKWNYLIE